MKERKKERKTSLIYGLVTRNFRVCHVVGLTKVHDLNDPEEELWGGENGRR